MGICMKDEPYYIVTEYMVNGSLLDFLKRNSEILEVGQLVDISSQVGGSVVWRGGGGGGDWSSNITL